MSKYDKNVDFYSNQCYNKEKILFMLRWLIKMVKTLTKRHFTKIEHEEKARGRNLLLSEMKTAKIRSNPNSLKRGRNLLINAYRMSNWKNDDK